MKGNKILTVDITQSFGRALEKAGFGDDSNSETDITKAGIYDVLDALSGKDNNKFSVEQARVEFSRRGL